MSSRTYTPEDQFEKYHSKLRDELNKAYTHYEICKKLREFRTSRGEEFSEALTFLGLTIDAHLFATVMSINRFIDKRQDSLKMDVFFKFVEDNLGLFSDEAYEKRLRDKKMSDIECAHWMEKQVKITRGTIGQDKNSIKNLPIRNLKDWRDKKLAHVDRDIVLKDVDVMKESPVTIGEIDQIIDTLNGILNRYSLAYNGTEWIIGLPPVIPQIEYIFDAIGFFVKSKNIRI